MFWMSHTRYYCCSYYCYAFAAPIVLLGLATAAHAYSAHADARSLLDELRALASLTALTQRSISTLSRHVDDILTHACAESASSSSSSSSSKSNSSKSEDDDEDAQII